MPVRKANHPYADRAALERLLLLISTIVHHPGIGGKDDTLSDPKTSNLELVKQQMYVLAPDLGLSLPDYSIHTLRKDILTLRRYGILEASTYRQGYYLGTGVMTPDELRLALNALHSQAEYQQDVQVNQAYHAIMRRLKNSQLSKKIQYPVRTYINQPVVDTDPIEMMNQGRYEKTLFDKLENVEEAILQGRGIELHRVRQGHSGSKKGHLQVYPLQLVYFDLAWYLLCESCKDGLLAFHRIDRFSDHCKTLAEYQRPLTQQLHRLEIAHTLRRDGWGLYLGNLEQQQQELQGKIELVQITVRFFETTVPFVIEGKRRHPSQELKLGPIGKKGQFDYVDYRVKLPERSLQEFSYWVNKHMESAQFIEPEDMVQKHYKSAQTLVQRYLAATDNRLLNDYDDRSSTS